MASRPPYDSARHKVKPLFLVDSVLEREQRLAHEVGQLVGVADVRETDAVIEDLRALVDEVIAQERHQHAHLLDRAIPVPCEEKA